MLRRVVSLSVVSAVISVVSSVAGAADLPVYKAPPRVTVVQNWTGWYIGGSVGYVDGQVTRGTPSFAPSSNLKPKGVVGTILGGYDYQFANNVVLGVRGAVPILSISSTTPSGGALPFGAKVDRAAILAGRAGYAFGNILPYVVGGGAWGRGTAQVIGFANVTNNHTGYIVGGGVEFRVAGNWTVDVNYTHTGFGKKGYNFTPFGGIVVQQGFTSDNFSVGANYRF